MRRVHVLALGGTIAMTAPAGGGVVPRLGAEELLAGVPGLAQVAEVSTEQVLQVPSASLRPSDVVRLAERVEEVLGQGVHGVVVTQGTDTLEESAFLLDLLLERGPVVVTGAMRPPGSPGADGPANLAAAVRVACSPRARGLGVLVALDEQVHAAARVRKVRTFGPAAFASPGGGPLGWVVEGELHLLARPEPLPRVPRPAPETLDEVWVPVVPVGLGESPRHLEAVAAAGCDGFVLEAVGAGHVPADLVEPLAALASRLPVVLASRTGAGPVHTRTYGYRGSERELLEAGLVPAGWFDARRARVLLGTLIAAGVREGFEPWFSAARDA